MKAAWPRREAPLPDAVLRKVYCQNALRVAPGLPRFFFFLLDPPARIPSDRGL